MDLAGVPAGSVTIYQTADGDSAIDVRPDGETVWLSRQQLAALYCRDVKTIGKHVESAARRTGGNPSCRKIGDDCDRWQDLPS
jgi:streptogramin lyase